MVFQSVKGGAAVLDAQVVIDFVVLTRNKVWCV